METESLKKSSDSIANEGGNYNEKECKESHNDDKTETDCDETRNKQNLEKIDSFSESETNQKHLETSFDSDVEDEEDGQFRLNVSDKSDEDDSDDDINFHEANKENDECKDDNVKETNKENDVECKDDDVEEASKKNDDVELIPDSSGTESTFTVDHSDAIENCKTQSSLNPSNDATKDLTGSNCETENMETNKERKNEDTTLDSNEITDSEEKNKYTEKGNSENEPEAHTKVEESKEDAQKENNENENETEDHTKVEESKEDAQKENNENETEDLTKDERNKEHEQNENEKSKDESEDRTKVEEKKKDDMEPEYVKDTVVISDKDEELNDKSTNQSKETDTTDESKEHDARKQNVENSIQENESEDDDDCVEIISKEDNIIELTDDEQDFPSKTPEDPLSLKNASEGGEDGDIDDDFDPSLLCPDINMEVDEAPVITSNDAPPPEADGTKSPSLYAPVFSTFVDEATGAEVEFNLTPAEEQLRRETYGQKQPVQFTKIHCTACNIHLGSALDGQSNRFVHPLLKVLICKNCYHFYTSGEFEKDEDGSELYCRWCGQGGQVICCSNCEMVFCKKCIRINFDKKKMAEIRDSDEWQCFRCNPSQLTRLRIHCAEFMEYITRELSRLQTLEDRISFMKTDHSLCCKNLKRKSVDELSNGKKKRRKWVIDPDYDPIKDEQPPDILKKKLTESSFTPVKPEMNPPKFTKTTPVPIAPKLVPLEPNIPKLTAIGNSNIIQVGSTTFKKTLIPNQKIILTPIPLQKGATSLISSAIKEASKSTLPSPPSTIRVIKRQTLLKKNTWFDKGVTGTARVNSNLSYTMTQLYKTLAKAGTVEEKAAVHNKFQEALSSSINNLIQIRKNLRADFIADLKTQNTVNQPKPSTSKSLPDDDVIIISSSSQPPPLTPVKTTPSILQSVSLLKKPTSPIIRQPSTKTPPAKAPPAKTPPVQPLLRVKPLQALQNVSPECILIPDDDNNDNNNKKNEKLLNGGSGITIRKLTGKKNSELSVSKTADDKKDEVVKLSDTAKKQIDWNSIKKVRVVVRKSDDVEKLVQQQMKKMTNNRD